MRNVIPTPITVMEEEQVTEKFLNVSSYNGNRNYRCNI